MSRHHILTAAALIAGPLLAAGAARADDTYTLDKVTITGAKSVPLAQLQAAVKEQPHTKVTKEDIVADQDNISTVLTKANVVGGIKTSMVNKPGKHIEIIFAITDNGMQAPTVTKVALKLDAEAFTGNNKINTATLTTAANLKPGDVVTDQVIQDALNRIGDVYKKKNLGVDIKPAVTYPTKATVDITWQVTEKKAPKEEKKKDDEY